MNKFATRVVTLSVVAGVAAVSSASAALNLPTQDCSYVFNTNIRRNSTGQDVLNLQKVLNMFPQTQVASTGAGSPGMETSFFGPATHNAVVKFQNLHAADILTPSGLTAGNGNVYTLTRAVLNQICVPGTTTPTPTDPTTPAGSVTATLGAAVPYTVLVAGQASARLADFTFTGNGVVTNVKLNRTGISSNTTLKNVYLYDGAVRLTDSASILADGSINFNNPAGIFTVAGMRNITVRADIETGTSGQSVGVSLTGYTVAGQTPVPTALNGTQLPIAQVSTLTTVVLQNNTPNVANANVQAGSSNYTVWRNNVNVGMNAGKLQRASFKIMGSTPTSAISNLGLYVNGQLIATPSAFGLDGLVTFDLTASPFTLNTATHLVEVRADVVGGAGTSFRVSLQSPTDLLIEDSTIAGVAVTATNANNNRSGEFTITEGDLSINSDSAFTATQVVSGGTNVVLGQYKIKSYGEDVKLIELEVQPVLTGVTPAADGLANVGLYINGGAYSSTRNWNGSGTLTFENLNYYLPVGQEAVLTIKGDIKTQAGVNYTAGSVQIDLVAGASNIEGLTSREFKSTVAKTGRSLTIVSGGANFARSAGFSAQSTNADTNNVKLGSFILNASNADDLRLTGLNVGLTFGGTMTLQSVSNLRVVDASNPSVSFGSPSQYVSVTGSNNFSTNLVIPKSTSKTFDVYADIGQATTGDSVTAGMTATYSSVTNGVSTSTPATGVAVSIGTAALAENSPAVASNPAASYVTPGEKLIATFRVKSTGGASTISEITLDTTNLHGATAVKVGGVVKELGATHTSVLVDGLNISVPNGGTGAQIPVYVTYGDVGAPGNDAGLMFSGATNTVAITDIGYKSGGTGVVLHLTSGSLTNSVSKTFTLVKSFPASVKTTDGSSKISTTVTNRKLGSVTIKADNSGAINLTQLPITIGLTSGMDLDDVWLTTSGGGAIDDVTYATTTSTLVATWVAGEIIDSTGITFDVYGNVSGTPSGDAEYPQISITNRTDFLWDDTNGVTFNGNMLPNFGN